MCNATERLWLQCSGWRTTAKFQDKAGSDNSEKSSGELEARGCSNRAAKFEEKS